jgi:hypothetical protein
MPYTNICCSHRIMSPLLEDDLIRISWCIAFSDDNVASKTIVRPMTRLSYGMTATFNNLLEDLLKDHVGVDVFFSEYDVSAEAHMTSNFDGKCLFPVPMPSSKVRLYLKNLPAKCICFTAVGSFSASAPSNDCSAVNALARVMDAQKTLKLPSKWDTSKHLNAHHLTYNKLIHIFEAKSLGWLNGGHLKDCGNVGHCHLFLEHLSSLLSMLSQHHTKCESMRIIMADWITQCILRQYDRRLLDRG